MQVFKLFFSLLLSCCFSFSFGQFSDNFSDGDFTANPTWSGDNAKFTVSGAFELWQNAPIVADTAYLSTPSQSINNATWEFLVRMDFNPSSSNFSRVYLVSDVANLKYALNGYYVMLGNTDDEVSLYKQTGTSVSKIIDGRNGSLNASFPIVRVRVTRDSIGNWDLQNDTTGGTTFISEGTVNDVTHIKSNYFGVRNSYTSTRSDKFFFDDFNVTGQVFVDTVKPTVTSVSVISNTQLDVQFSEFVTLSSAQTLTNYSVNNGLGNPSSAIRDVSDSTLVHLTFSGTFVNGQQNILSVSNVVDLASNTMVSSNHNFMYFIPDVPAAREVVINELMADQTPVVNLPEAEFVELHNPTNKNFDLFGWTLSDGSSTATLPSYPLLAGEYVILIARTDTAAFSGYSKIIPLTSFPSLNNAGDIITLTDSSGLLIDRLNYSDSWYQDATKKAGGWTLEQINPTLPCSGKNNWIASNNSNGGTPGAQNSVYSLTPDTKGPSITKIEVITPARIDVHFDEKLDSNAVLTANYSVNNGIGINFPVNIPPDYDKLTLFFTNAISAGTLYTLTISGLTDCSGNNIFGNKGEFVLPQQGTIGDVVINEVLFDPKTGGVDFVELYSTSSKYIGLKDWKLANYDSNKDTLASFKSFPEQYILYPNEYVVITTDSSIIKKEYPNAKKGKFIQLSSLPTYSNDKGNVIVINNNDTLIERFDYTDDMHFPLLNDKEGVSLERIDPARPVDDVTNWHSASEDVGFATPGFLNSQFYLGTSEGEITVEPEIFSPDNDGYNDILNIHYDFGQGGYVGTIIIYDDKGRQIRSLMNNETLAATGTISWDGINDNAEKARIGIYIIYMEAFDIEGNIQKHKKTAVLAGKL